MAIARVQATAYQYTGGGASQTHSFGSLPTVGNLIMIPIGMGGVTGNESVSISDNQGVGNVYTTQISANNADSKVEVAYCYNVQVSGGTFTVTITRTGASLQETTARCIEYSGFGAANPLVGLASGAVAGVSVSAGPTGALGAIPEALVVGVLAGRQPTFGVPSITVESVSPAWNEEGEHVGGQWGSEADTRVVSNGNAQSISWTIGSHGLNGMAMIAAFYSNPPGATARLTQLARELLELDGTSPVHLTQLAREVMYPFTCTPQGPSPSPTGCPGTTSTAPVTGNQGCADEV